MNDMVNVGIEGVIICVDVTQVLMSWYQSWFIWSSTILPCTICTSTLMYTYTIQYVSQFSLKSWNILMWQQGQWKVSQWKHFFNYVKIDDIAKLYDYDDLHSQGRHRLCCVCSKGCLATCKLYNCWTISEQRQPFYCRKVNIPQYCMIVQTCRLTQYSRWHTCMIYTL